MKKPKGSVLLLVVCILLIIGCVFTLGTSLLTGLLGSVIGSNADLQSVLRQAGITAQAAENMAQTLTVLMVVTAVVELIAAICGIVYRNNVKKAKAILILGVIVAAWSITSQIIETVALHAPFSIVGAILGLVLPILYVIGAILNMRSE